MHSNVVTVLRIKYEEFGKAVSLANSLERAGDRPKSKMLTTASKVK